MPTYLYGSEMWPLNKTVFKDIELLHHHCLRTAVNAKWNPDKQPFEDWMKRTTDTGQKSYNEKHKHPILLFVTRVVTHLQAAYSKNIASTLTKQFQREVMEWRSTQQ